MFGITISYTDVQTIFQTFWNTEGYNAMLAVVVGAGIVGMVIGALRSGLFGASK